MTEQDNDVLTNLLKNIYDKDYKNTKITVDVNPNSMIWPTEAVCMWAI